MEQLQNEKNNDSMDQDLEKSVKECNISGKKYNQVQQSLNSFSEDSKKTSSQSFQTYKQILYGANQNHRCLSELISQLEKHEICYNSKYFDELQQGNGQNNFRIDFIKPTKHYQLALIKASLGPFSQTLKIYNTFQHSVFNKNKILQDGKATNIYRLKIHYKQYIIKSIAFSSYDQMQSEHKSRKFIHVLSEFFIGKIMSVLKIGPKLCDQFGFDIYLSQKQVFFIIEPCETKFKKFTENDGRSLKRDLKQMHLLSILHNDIKPDNIMYSPTFGKYVFIDFGITEFRNECIGQLSYTGFGGTYTYCMEEMKKLFKSNSSGWIDLYCNDAYGLQLSIKDMEKYQIDFQQPQNKIELIKNVIYDMEDFMVEVKLKFNFFILAVSKKCNYSAFSEQINLTDELFEPLMKFLYEIPLTERIKQIYNKKMEDFAQKQDNFEDLREILSNRIYFESCKGKRKFLSAEESQKIQHFQEFYEELSFFYCENKKQKKNSIQQLEQILFSAEKINDLDKSQHESFLIEYINYRRIEPTITLNKKIQALLKYIKKYQLDGEKPFQSMAPSEILDLFFSHKLKCTSMEWKIKDFDDYLIILNNYFVYASIIDIDVVKQIQNALFTIEMSDEFQIICKVQYMILLFLVVNSFSSVNLKYIVYQEISEINNMVKMKAEFYFAKAKQQLSTDSQLLQIYATCMSQFLFSYGSISKANALQILTKSNLIKSQSKVTTLLIDYIQYKLLTKLEIIDGFNYERKLKEEMLIEQIQNQKLFNENYFTILLFYLNLKQIKMLENLLQILDNCIKIPQISTKHFIFYRLFIIIYQNDKLKKQDHTQIEKCCSMILQLIAVDKQNILTFVFMIQSLLQLQIDCSSLKLQIPEPVVKFKELMIKNVPEFINLYDQLEDPIIYRGSFNELRLHLLWLNLQFQFPKKCKQFGYSSTLYQSYWQIYPKIQSFRQIIKTKRQNFIEEDHVYLLFFDLIELKSQNSARAILNYLHSKKIFIKKVFQIEDHEKICILNSFMMVLYIFNHQKDLNYLKEAIDIIYPIVQNMLNLNSSVMTDFNKLTMKSFIRLNRFNDLFDEIIKISKFYSEHISKSNVVRIYQFFITIVKQTKQVKKQTQFFSQLDKLLAKIEIKKLPVFGLFLLYCIRTFNRKFLLKLLLESLSSIKHVGRYFILASYYKEVIKSNSKHSERRIKFLYRKDIRYPSSYTKNLEEMKNYLGFSTKQFNCSLVLREVLEKKIIKMGKCCEIYSEKKMPHPMRQILSHSIFDDEKKENGSKNWQNGRMSIQIKQDYFGKQMNFVAKNMI